MSVQPNEVPKLKATHQATFGNHADVTAWQFDVNSPMPIWVVKKFHRYGPPGEWKGIACLNGKEVEITATTGEWAVVVDHVTIVVLTDKEFKDLFRPLRTT